MIHNMDVVYEILTKSMYEKLENEVLRDRYARIKASKNLLIGTVKMFLEGFIGNEELRIAVEQAEKDL